MKNSIYDYLYVDIKRYFPVSDPYYLFSGYSQASPPYIYKGMCTVKKLLRLNVLHINSIEHFQISVKDKNYGKVKSADFFSCAINWRNGLSYEINKGVYLLGSDGYILKIDTHTDTISFVGVIAVDTKGLGDDLMDLPICHPDNKLRRFFKDNSKTELINSSVGLYLHPEIYDEYVTTKKRGRYLMKALDSFKNNDCIGYDNIKLNNIYPCEEPDSIIVKDYDYQLLAKEVKRKNPQLNNHQIATKLDVAFQSENAVKFITNIINSIIND